MLNLLREFLSRHIEVTEAELQLFGELDLFKKFQKGEFLLKEGEMASQYFFVIRGCIRAFYATEGGERTTAFYLEEEGVSPESLYNGQPSRYFIQCEEDCDLLVASPALEAKVFSAFPKFESLCRVLGEKEMAKQQAGFADFIQASPEERYQQLITTRPQLLQRVAQYKIASYIGTTPETLSRIRNRMAKN